jgi:hypothetical protein
VTEALRIVKLSGFYACAHVLVGEQTSVDEIGRLFPALEARRFDGIVVSSGGSCAGAASDTILGNKLTETTEMIPSRRWRKLSRTLEASYLQTSAVKEQPNAQPRGADACEESA